MKETLWNIFESAVSVYEGLNVFYFIFAFLDYNFQPTKNKIVYLCGALLNTCIVFTLNAFLFYEGIWGMTYIIFTFCYTLFFVRRNPIRVFFVTFLAYLWILSVNAFVTTFISDVASTNLVDLYTKQTLERFIMILTVQLLVTYAYRITLKIFRKNGIQLRPQEWLLIVVVFVLSFSVILMIHVVQLNYQFSKLHHDLLLLSCLGLAAINIVCYYMIIQFSRANAVRAEHELLLLETSYRKHYAENAKHQYEEIRRIRHDMKQSYCVVQQLVSEKRYAELDAYLPQMNDQINSMASTVNTDHAIINAILNTKLSTAKKMGIKVFCNTVKDLHAEQIEEIDLCHLLGNLLDNAIEAAEKCPDGTTKYIEIAITERNQILAITIKNSYCENELQPELKINKSNKAEHGFGLKTVKRIAKKYHGFVDIYTENHLFCCGVTLQIES